MKRKILLWILLGATAAGYTALIVVARARFGPLAGVLVMLGAVCGLVAYAVLDALGDACDAAEDDWREIVCPGCGARFELHLTPGTRPKDLPQNCPLCGSALDMEAYLRKEAEK